jgi:(2Fe-2S) ferredoxin
MSKEKHTPAKLIYICTGEKCKKRGSKEISKMLRSYAEDRGYEDVGVIRTHCTDNCKLGPVICLQPNNSWHFHINEQKAMELVKMMSAVESQKQKH